MRESLKEEDEHDLNSIQVAFSDRWRVAREVACN